MLIERSGLTKWLKRWLPALVIMIIIFVISGTPSARIPNLGLMDTLYKKIGHMTGYFLLHLAFKRGLSSLQSRGIWVALGLSLIYAISDELHQLFIPGRNASMIDVCIDVSGAVLGLILYGRWGWLERIVDFSGL